MDPLKIDISIIARDQKLSPENVEASIQLLDEGNTIPFITRFRKDLTGGLNEEQLLAIKSKVALLRALADRKSTILRAIETQGELTETLKSQIQKTTSSRRLEDIYLPYKSKKQSRASLARQQGLGLLADEILSTEAQSVDFATRATDFVRVDKGLNSVDDVIKGVGDLVSEKFAEHDGLRMALRKLIREKGELNSHVVVANEKGEAETATETKPNNASESVASTPAAPNEAPPASTDAPPAAETTPAKDEKANAPVSTGAPVNTDTAANTDAAQSEVTETKLGNMPAAQTSTDEPATAEPATAESTAAESTAGEPSVKDVKTPEVKAEGGATAAQPEPAAAKPKAKKKKKKKKEQDPYKDYYDFSQAVSKLPHYRVLAINRGERAAKLKVKIKIDSEKVNDLAFQHLVPADHPSESFLKKCAIDTVNRSLLPSIEREIRRELTEAAERHAVDVFASNLKNLLLQPPIRNRTIMAIDPGYKRGCSVAIVDNCGNLIESGQVFVVGNQTRRDESKIRIRDWVKNHKVDIIAIGNGTGCRQVEQMVSDTIAEQLTDEQVRYIIINEAGTSIYSTSETGREELPDVSPAVRSAVSIGRRLLDPLSELVKISPANIGVGMYQHDIKAKHLSESLDSVVQFCVNRVGVDVNTAGASLLKYVSGLNALTARRVIEYRQENGRFNCREDLRKVSGVGDTTYVQAAGFLRIHGGENALDATSIHPECYPIASDVLEKVSASVDEVFPRWLMQPAREELAQAKLAQAKLEPASTPAAETPAAIPPVADSAATTASEKPVASAETEASTAGTPAVEAQEQKLSAELSTEADSSTVVEPAAEAPVAANSAVEDASSPAASDPPVAVEPMGTSASATEPSATEPSVAASESAGQDAASGEEGKPSNRREFEANRKEIVKRLNALDIDELALSHGSGKLLVKDVIMSLKRPAWDPRDKVQKPLFRRGILKVDDLKPEMQLDGQVVNVVDFGVFVDIGLGESSLVHVSQLSNHYISDPYKHFSVGDVLKVWVTDVDAPRRRVKLTAVRPGSNKPVRNHKRRSDNKRTERKSSTDGRSSSKPNAGGNARTSDRPPRRKSGKYEGRGSQSRGSAAPRRDKRRSGPKVVKKITDKMLRGDEPMRSFSDLAQFVKKKPEVDKSETKPESDSAKNENKDNKQG